MKECINLPFTIYDLPFTIYDLRFKDLRFLRRREDEFIYYLRFTIYDLFEHLDILFKKTGFYYEDK